MYSMAVAGASEVWDEDIVISPWGVLDAEDPAGPYDNRHGPILRRYRNAFEPRWVRHDPIAAFEHCQRDVDH